VPLAPIEKGRCNVSSRHQRRKAAKAKAAERLEGLAQAERSRRVAVTVKANKSAPIERNYYPASIMGNLSEYASRGYVARNTKSLDFLPRGSVARGFNKG
jgi:hypothetical protein